MSRGAAIEVPRFVREVVEEVAFQARSERKIDKRSGVSQRLPISVLETAVSNAERRALANGESPVVPRVTDIYAALPSMTGKFELEYEGELKGADQVARDLVRAAVANVFDGYFADADLKPVIEWFDLGGSLTLSDTTAAATLVEQAAAVQGLVELAHRAGIAPTRRRRCSRPASTSCSKGCIRRRRSAAATSAAITAPNRSVAPQPRSRARRC